MLIVALPVPSKLAEPVASPESPKVLAVSSLVAEAAFPEVSWLPAVLTPGRSISAVPSNDTPPMLRALSKAVAVAAFPVVSWLPVWFTPGRLISAVPSNDTPPMFLQFQVQLLNLHCQLHRRLHYQLRHQLHRQQTMML